MLDVPRTALLIVDVQKDFCEGGALAVRGGDRVVPVLNQVIRLLTPQGAPILASRDWHPAQTTHFRGGGGAWPPHCVAGTAGAAFHEDLQLPAGTIWISKGQAPGEDGYSAFDGTTPRGARSPVHSPTVASSGSTSAAWPPTTVCSRRYWTRLHMALP